MATTVVVASSKPPMAVAAKQAGISPWDFLRIFAALKDYADEAALLAGYFQQYREASSSSERARIAAEAVKVIVGATPTHIDDDLHLILEGIVESEKCRKGFDHLLTHFRGGE